MTVPPPVHREPRDRVGVEIDESEPVAVPIVRDSTLECPDIALLGSDECEAKARETVRRLAPVLSVRPQPLLLVLELLECEFDLKHGCAEQLFWLAHERGYLSLHEGRVHLGRASAG
jgi:hypothetical protein